tara:strand:+ start:22765 stop:23322 length:558 start_codon:yes stop_codon:yes gene_type:complete
MKTENLVILKGTENFTLEGFTMKAHTPYRHKHMEKGFNATSEHIVWGWAFTDKQFGEMFETVHEKLMRIFTFMELIKDGKPISRTAFGRDYLDIHTYGRGRNNSKVGYLCSFIDNNKEIVGFYPQFSGETKTQTLKDCYTMFIETLNGNMGFVDCKRVQLGNCGIPTSYGDLRSREILNRHKAIL